MPSPKREYASKKVDAVGDAMQAQKRFLKKRARKGTTHGADQAHRLRTLMLDAQSPDLMRKAWLEKLGSAFLIMKSESNFQRGAAFEQLVLDSLIEQDEVARITCVWLCEWTCVQTCVQTCVE